MIDRYPSIDGVRLDTDEQQGHAGPALDLYGTRRCYPLWIRESGSSRDGTDKCATIPLSLDDIEALRDGCNRLLLRAGRPVAVIQTGADL